MTYDELITQTNAEDYEATLGALNDIAEKKFRGILPSEGVWTVGDLAIYLGLPPHNRAAAVV
jgi:hypothetical protein